jgi:Tfp pilus assembly protein PilX
MMIRQQNRSRERGATALIVVMFSVLLFITITVAFMKIMADEQSRTNDNELSQGAYDSALAGVEDGKRVLSSCLAGQASACSAVNDPSHPCVDFGAVGLVNTGSNNEVYLKTTSGANGTDFAQAYTCVKIIRDTPDYEGQISAEPYQDLVYLNAVGPYTKIRLSWFSKNNLAGKNIANPLYYAGPVGNRSLLDLEAWQKGSTSGRPQIMRATYIPDVVGGAHDTDDKTLYLFPHAKAAVASDINFALDNRRQGEALNLVSAPVCLNTFNNAFEEYACTATLVIPAATNSSYLYLASPYGAVDYKVELLDGSNTPVYFNGVQPIVDSTGRAADVFRRVSARVERSTGGDARSLYPRATIDITNNFCKSFAVGATVDAYRNTVSDCDPLISGN